MLCLLNRVVASYVATARDAPAFWRSKPTHTMIVQLFLQVLTNFHCTKWLPSQDPNAHVVLTLQNMITPCVKIA